MVRAGNYEDFNEKQVVSFVSAHLSSWMPYDKAAMLGEYLEHFPEYREEIMRVYG